MRAREAAAARARDAAAAAAAAHAETLLAFQITRTPEELAADAAADKHDMITGAAENQQAARARAENRAVSEKEQKQRDQDEKAAKLQRSALLTARGSNSCATTKPFASPRYAVTNAQRPSLCLE